MIDQPLPIEPFSATARTVHALRPAGLAAFLAGVDAAVASYIRACAFSARAGELVLLPGALGVSGAVFGLGNRTEPHGFGALPFRLPEGTWQLAPGDFDMQSAALGFCLGGYRYSQFKKIERPPARLAIDASAATRSQAASAWMVRDLINAPANVLGPAELAALTIALAGRYDAATFRVTGAELQADYPTIAAVGAGSDRAPQVAGFHWHGSGATADAPHVWLCGKGVCFDSGGYDLKPSAGMLRMKKDMGGAANILGLARIIMDADLPLRLSVSIGCVENSVSGSAMRPLDIIRTRKGLTVEIGNTDAEGRLVLCDLLSEASDSSPALIVDCATLTGAARVAIGPDLPALFANDDAVADALLAAAVAVHDPLWRLPLWDGYESWLDSPIADLNNVSSKAFAGAVTAALYLRRFVAPSVPWIHLDMYAWNDTTQPGRPEGGEAMGIRALFDVIKSRFCRQDR